MKINHNRARRAVYVCLIIQAIGVVLLLCAAIWFPHVAPAAMCIVFSMAAAVIVILLLKLYDKKD